MKAMHMGALDFLIFFVETIERKKRMRDSLALPLARCQVIYNWRMWFYKSKKESNTQTRYKMKFTTICCLLAIIEARPHKRHTTGQLIEKQHGREGHQFGDVAWLFANHRNKLPSRRKRIKKINSDRILAELKSRNLISAFPQTRTIRINQHRRNQRQVLHYSRKRPVPMDVLRQFRHIMTNIPQ